MLSNTFNPESMCKHVESLTAVSRSAGTVNGTAGDFKGCGDILALFKAGTNVATGTHDVKLQDSADNSTFADISGAAFVQVTTANDNQAFKAILRKGSYRRYVRAVSVVATADCVGGVDLIGFGLQRTELADAAAAYAFIKAAA